MVTAFGGSGPVFKRYDKPRVGIPKRLSGKGVVVLTGHLLRARQHTGGAS